MMKINAIQTQNYYKQKSYQTDKNNYVSSNISQNGLIENNSYPANYYLSNFGISFGAKRPIGGYVNNQQSYTFSIKTRTTQKATNDKILICSLLGSLSNNEKVLPDMVEFISTNKKYSRLFQNSQGNFLTVAPSEWVDFMGSFLKAYPQYEKDHKNGMDRLSLEFIKKTHLGAEKLESFQKTVETDIQNFVFKIVQLKNVPTDFPYAVEMLNKIAVFANPLVLKTDSTNKDFAKLLNRNFSYDEMRILNGNNETKEYNELFPEGIKNKMRGIIQQPKYHNIENAALYSVLQELLDKNIIDNEYINEVLATETSLNKAVKKLLEKNQDFYETNLMKINNNYNKYKLQLNKDERNKIKEALIAYNYSYSSNDDFNLDIYLQTQGNYLKKVLKDDTLSQIIKTKFWNDFDSVYGTNYADTINDDIKQKKILNDCLKLLDELDDLDFDDEFDEF